MKKTLSILLISSLPMLALAGGNHAGAGHGETTTGQTGATGMAGMQKNMTAMQQGVQASAAGKAGDPAKVSHTVAVSMDDSMRFTPSQIPVKAGETIRFFVKNGGKLAHEMVIGELAELKAHAEMMRKMPGMQHAEPNMIALAAGQRGGIVWQFEKAGSVDFACLVPGHMEAGMVGQVQVEQQAVLSAQK